MLHPHPNLADLPMPMKRINTGAFSFTMSYSLPGAAEWGLNFPEANGENQSPINLNSREAVYDAALHENQLKFNYVLCRETDMCNNGHTVVVYLKYKPGRSCKEGTSQIDFCQLAQPDYLKFPASKAMSEKSELSQPDRSANCAR